MNMLSLIDADRRAIETVQYLKGTHPDFRDPPGGALVLPLADQLARNAPVGLTDANGTLEATNPGQPQKIAPAEKAARLDGLRSLTQQLLDEAVEKQLPRTVCSRFEAYAEALVKPDPTYLTLDGPMAILKASRGDSYLTEALDKGFLAGWTKLIGMHEELSPFLMPEDRSDDLPDPAPDATPEEAEKVTGEIIDVMQDGRDQGVVGESVLAYLRAGTNYFEAAKAQMEQRTTLLKRGLVAVAGLVALIEGAAGFAANLTTIQAWVVSPQGQTILGKLAPLFQRLLNMFGA